jgi:hypothetical protein
MPAMFSAITCSARSIGTPRASQENVDATPLSSFRLAIRFSRSERATPSSGESFAAASAGFLTISGSA